MLHIGLGRYHGNGFGPLGTILRPEAVVLLLLLVRFLHLGAEAFLKVLDRGILLLAYCALVGSGL